MTGYHRPPDYSNLAFERQYSDRLLGGSAVTYWIFWNNSADMGWRHLPGRFWKAVGFVGSLSQGRLIGFLVRPVIRSMMWCRMRAACDGTGGRPRRHPVNNFAA